MCKAMEDLIKDEEAKGILKTLIDLIKDAALRAGMTEEQFREEMKRFSESNNLNSMNLF